MAVHHDNAEGNRGEPDHKPGGRHETAPMITGPTSHSFMSQRLRLHYVDWGNEGAPTLILLHGGRDHCRNWDWVAAAFRDRYHVICPDLRGHGDSDWAPDGDYTRDAFVADLEGFREALGLEHFILMGHSMGGLNAVSFYILFGSAWAG